MKESVIIDSCDCSKDGIHRMIRYFNQHGRLLCPWCNQCTKCVFDIFKPENYQCVNEQCRMFGQNIKPFKRM